MIRIDMEPISIIVAVDEDGGFGKAGKIPWNIPEDMKHFMSVTKNSICIMGRRTYEDMLEMTKVRVQSNIAKENEKAIELYNSVENNSEPLPEKKKAPKIKSILPGRECYVVTSKKGYKAEGATAVKSIREAIHSLQKEDKREVFILGGQRMFVEALAFATKVYMTVIKGDTFGCDVFFPVKTLNNFKITEGTETDKLRFVTYTR